MSTVNPPPGTNNAPAVGRSNGPGRQQESGDVAQTRGGRASDSGRVAGTPTSPAAGSSPVSLSETARQVAEIEAGIDRSPAFDEEKVSALREAISRGAYTIDTASLASKIMALELGP